MTQTTHPAIQDFQLIQFATAQTDVTIEACRGGETELTFDDGSQPGEQGYLVLQLDTEDLDNLIAALTAARAAQRVAGY